MINVSDAVSLERVDDQWVALVGARGEVHRLSGQAAAVIDAVIARQPIPVGHDDAVAALVASGVIVAPNGWSRRRVMGAGAAAAAAGIATLALPKAVAAASI
jgi:hypothetical protein